jgi:multiple sugar transport system substrate-binding protein
MRKLFAILLAVIVVAAAGAQAKEIRVLLANHPYGDLLKAAIPEFEAATGIKVNMEQYQEAQLSTKLVTEFATGSSTVDVFMSRPLQEAKMFYRNGWLQPLTSYDFSDFPKAALGLVSFGTKTYAVPIVTEWQVLYYRIDLLKKAGIPVPKTFAELEAAAKKLNSADVAGFASRGKGNPAVTQLSTYIYNFGGNYIEKGQAAFASANAIEAIRFYGRMLGTYGPAGITAMSWDNIMPVFQAGKIAMWTDASVFYGQIVEPAKSQVPAANVGMASLPAGPAGSHPYFVVSWSIAVAKKAKNPDGAQQFLAWATSKEMAKKALVATIPMARDSAWADKEALAKVLPALIETRAFAAKNGMPYDRPYMSAVGEARDRIGEVIVESINSKGESVTLQAIAERMVSKVNELLEDTGEFGVQ